MQGVLPLKPLSNQKSSQTVVDMFTDDGLLVGQVAKKGSTRRQVTDLSSWMEAWNILHSDCAQTALELVKYQHIICQLFAPDGSSLEPVPSRLTTTPAGTTPPSGAHGASHPQVLGPRLWWRALCQGLAMCCTTSSHHSTTSKLTPLYNSELTPLYDHELTSLYDQNSHRSVTSELTPLYDQNSHRSVTSEFTPLYDQNSHRSVTSELTPLYDQNSHRSVTSELTPLYDQNSHRSVTSEFTSLYDQNSHRSVTSELTPLYNQ
eukprot:Em0014g379a